MGKIVKVATPPTALPFDLAECKAHLSYVQDDLDDLIERLMTDAAAFLQGPDGVLGLTLITTTYNLFLDAFPDSDDEITIPLPPLQTTGFAITYTDPDGVEQTMPAQDYVIDADSVPGRVYLGFGKSWPSTRDQRKAVTVAYKAGYGNNYTLVPGNIRQLGMGLVSHWFQQREMAVYGGGSFATTPLGFDALIAPIKVRGTFD